MTTLATLPFLTALDPRESAEGTVDPLGFAATSERLAEWLVPGMTARMSRPRFLTTTAVAASVCEGLEEELANDGVTTPQLVLEWLLVEGFARKAPREQVGRTPGIDKARAGVASGEPLTTRTYLKTASSTGFHGVYRRLAENLRIVDADLRLGDNGLALLAEWEREQDLNGFCFGDSSSGTASGFQKSLRDAVIDGLRKGYSERSPSWQGWAFFADHLAPSLIGRRESRVLYELLLDDASAPRGELFRLSRRPAFLAQARDSDEELAVAKQLLANASPELQQRLQAILAFEQFCRVPEQTFLWMRYLSSHAGAATISAKEVAGVDPVRKAVSRLPTLIAEVDERLLPAPPEIRDQFAILAGAFGGITTVEALYAALLAWHSAVEKAKPPERKREWFERTADDRIIVRPLYRVDERPTAHVYWPRPYRLSAIVAFCEDFRGKLA